MVFKYTVFITYNFNYKGIILDLLDLDIIRNDMAAVTPVAEVPRVGTRGRGR